MQLSYINNLNKDNHKTLPQWNSMGRIILKGAKGIYLKDDGLYFHINDTIIDSRLAEQFLRKKESSKKVGFFIENKTKVEWNSIGHVVKKNSRGIYCQTKKTILFNLNDTFINRPLAKKLLRQQQYQLSKREAKKRDVLDLN